MSKDREPRTIQPEDFYRYKFLQDGQLSPDGKTAAYTVSHVDTEKDEEYVTIWLLSLETGEARQFTAGLTGDSNPRWSPDGEQIAFLSARGEKPQVYLIAVDGGEARALTAMPQGVAGGPVWSPDGQRIAFTAGPAELPLDLNQPYRVTRHIYRFDGIGYVDNAVQDIYIVPVKGGERRRLTNDECHNTDPVWSPDGKEILFSTSYWPDSHRIEPALRAVNLAGEVRELVMEWGSAQAAAWTPDGKRIVFLGNPLDVPYGTQGNLWVIDGQGGEPECRTAGLDFDVGGVLQPDMPAMGFASPRLLVAPDGESAYVRVQVGGRIQVYRVALCGAESWEPVAEGMPLALNDGRLLFGTGTVNDPLDLFIADVDGSNERRLTQINTGLLAGLALPTMERLSYPSSDGVKVEGWLLKPPLGQAPYPTVLYIHGGPAGGFGHIYSFDFQMLAGAGFAVLLINYRGSTGYGDEFSGAISGNLGHLEYDDLMAGVDLAIEKGLVDADRLGVCGLSYGGYLSAWIVGHTDRFKAAVPENPVINWASMYGVSDIGPSQVDEVGGLPHEVPEVYRHASPITYAHKCTTPTLLIQGEADHRCPAEQSEQFYAVLKANDCIVEMLRLPHMPHVGSMAGSLAARRAQNEALLDWMNRYVLGIAPEEKTVQIPDVVDPTLLQRGHKTCQER